MLIHDQGKRRISHCEFVKRNGFAQDMSIEMSAQYHEGLGLIHGYFGLGDASEVARAEAQRGQQRVGEVALAIGRVPLRRLVGAVEHAADVEAGLDVLEQAGVRGALMGAVAAAAITTGIFSLFGGQHPDALTDNLARGSWLAGDAFPGPALIASAAAVVVAAAPWLSRPWRRAAWLTLLLVAAARLLTGTVLPMELIIAIATGVTVGAAVLVAFGVPDRRMGPDEVAAALRRAGMAVESVRPAEVTARGSRKFAAVAADGRRLFVKALGSDQRDADLLYRAYRAVRLRNVGDTRPAASLVHAVDAGEHVDVDVDRAAAQFVDQCVELVLARYGG